VKPFIPNSSREKTLNLPPLVDFRERSAHPRDYPKLIHDTAVPGIDDLDCDDERE